jgi:hypothetical protein
MSASTWQRAFSEVWAVLKAFDLPEVSEWPIQEWRSALREFGRPGGVKPILRFGAADFCADVQEQRRGGLLDGSAARQPSPGAAQRPPRITAFTISTGAIAMAPINPIP